MLAKDEELTKVKEKHLCAEQQLRDMEEKQQQVNTPFFHIRFIDGWRKRMFVLGLSTDEFFKNGD